MNGPALLCTIAGVIIVTFGFAFWIASLFRNDKTISAETDEAQRRADGMLLQDKHQEAILLAKSKEMRDRMGADCCLHPDYKFKPEHRQVVGRK